MSHLFVPPITFGWEFLPRSGAYSTEKHLSKANSRVIAEPASKTLVFPRFSVKFRPFENDATWEKLWITRGRRGRDFEAKNRIFAVRLAPFRKCALVQCEKRDQFEFGASSETHRRPLPRQ